MGDVPSFPYAYHIQAKNHTKLQSQTVDAEKDEASKLIRRKNKLTTGINVSGSDIIETAQNILSNPEQLWQEGDLTMKRLVQNMVFDGPIRYSPSTNFGTSKFYLPFSMLSNLTAQNSNMVES